MNLERKLEILTDAARYDVACTSSGVDRDAKLGHLGNTSCAGICHSFAADGRCITLLKVLFSNACALDCAYCANRRSNDVPRATFAPRELATLTMEFYRRNFIEGLFISSAVIGSPDITMELIIECARVLREEEGFRGYIHAKAIPGCSPELIDRLGLLVDRLSINIELPSAESLSLLAPGKSAQRVMAPMQRIADRIEENLEDRRLARRAKAPRFAPAGQSTQLIVGATPESDFQILQLSKALYARYNLKRVFFSAYMPVNATPLLPDATTSVPLDREHRLYQADWLMRFYAFDSDELIGKDNPYLDEHVDPKAAWALRHYDQFPLEINRAPYELLLRIPGLGVEGARKVARARRNHTLGHDSLRKMGLSLKRMQYFITCNGLYEADLAPDRDLIYARLAANGNTGRKHNRGGGKRPLEGQLSLFESPQIDSSCLPAAFPERGSHQLTASQEKAYALQRSLIEQRKLQQEQARSRARQLIIA